MDIIKKYFPNLTPEQQQQFSTMLRLYPEWNEKINVISRKDIENLEVNHILHSMALARFVQFVPGTTVMDLGTGGGFPGLPLAALFPQARFHLVDRVGKKLKVAQDIATQAGLSNVTFQHGDVLEVKGQFHFVVSRAVMPLPDMVKLVRRFISKDNINSIPNGLLCLKGGSLEHELQPFKRDVLIDDIGSYFKEDFFKTKKIVYLPL
ncbi:MAG: 16S rRNA (guanine(527)-N(7))-methyltransferase RsmG [Muribaculaceae bacterium]|nr:16S rRNA (guanine(527)-N(7))-methyltransferase RsmG [Muribaculaceae bacterium]MBQ6649563.1 16S rRNA (guanine(527)-N(7))-methyltransferase RsmG [Muribaculaceae bacterium]